MNELIDLFLESAPERVLQIQQSVADAEKLAFHAHALKSVGLNLGCKRLSELSQHLESVARSGDLRNVSGIIRDLTAAFNETKNLLQSIRDQEAAKPQG